MNLKVSEEHAVRPYMAAQQRVYGIPAGMYACQVWGTEYQREGSEFKSQVQERQLCSLRRFLGVKSTATNWLVLRECGREP
eukprot:70380-Pelagomonas_calceolata.AAC.1